MKNAVILMGLVMFSSPTFAGQTERVFKAQAVQTKVRIDAIQKGNFATRTHGTLLPDQTQVKFFSTPVTLSLGTLKREGVAAALQKISVLLKDKGETSTYDKVQSNTAASALYHLAFNPGKSGLTVTERANLFQSAIEIDTLTCIHSRIGSKQDLNRCSTDIGLASQSFWSVLFEDAQQTEVTAAALDRNSMDHLLTALKDYLATAARDARADRKINQRANDLAAKAAKIQLENQKIDQAMQDARDKASIAMDAAYNSMVTGLISSVISTTGSVAASGLPSASTTPATTSNEAIRKKIALSIVGSLMDDKKIISLGCKPRTATQKTGITSVLECLLVQAQAQRQTDLQNLQGLANEASTLIRDILRQKQISAETKKSAAELQAEIDRLQEQEDKAQEEAKARGDRRNAIMDNLKKALETLRQMSSMVVL
ncbi:MAG: hypothetical protein JNL01_08340 [Bdellovibrionales bacterium]|nr:hypothetical protein [Bdellovibrionales bacterium]